MTRSRHFYGMLSYYDSGTSCDPCLIYYRDRIYQIQMNGDLPSQETVILLHYILGWKWQPTPVFLPGKFQGQRNLVGYSPWGCKELDMTKRLPHTPCLERDSSHLHKTKRPIPWLSPSPVSHRTSKDCSIHQCLFCYLIHRVIVTIFLNSIYMR